MRQKTFPEYVQNFKIAYEDLHATFVEKGGFALMVNGKETPKLASYENAVKAVIKAKMNNNDDNRRMVDALRDSSEYNYDQSLGIDDVLQDLFTKIIQKDILNQYYLKKNDPQYAFSSIGKSVTNGLIDMLKKSIHDSTDSLDQPIPDAKGQSLGSIIEDPHRDTEKEAYHSTLLKYGLTHFVHEMISLFLESDKPHYMIAYLNSIAERSATELYTDIFMNGFDAALREIIDRLRFINVRADYLLDLDIHLPKDPRTITKNDVHHWKYEAMKIVNFEAKRQQIIA